MSGLQKNKNSKSPEQEPKNPDDDVMMTHNASEEPANVAEEEWSKQTNRDGIHIRIFFDGIIRYSNGILDFSQWNIDF